MSGPNHGAGSCGDTAPPWGYGCGIVVTSRRWPPSTPGSERLWRSWMPSKKRRGGNETASMSAGKRHCNCEPAHRWAALSVCSKWTAARLLLIVHFEETGIRGDVFCPQLLHHRLHFMGPIVFAIREHVSKLVWIHGPTYGAPGCGIYAAPVGRWTIPLGAILNWSRRTGVDIPQPALSLPIAAVRRRLSGD